jgi:predicted TIM-barrel fold metal-dependent hydrolase
VLLISELNPMPISPSANAASWGLLLAEYGLSFDICIFHHQLPAAIELVKICTLSSDHLRKPTSKGIASIRAAVKQTIKLRITERGLQNQWYDN